MGVVKTWNGIARASVKTFDGIAVASVKTINGFDATTGGGALTLTYITNASDTVDRSSYTFAGQSIGAAADRDYVIVMAFGREIATSGVTISSLTIGGVSATQLVTANWDDSTNSSVVAIWYADVPTGTTADVVVNLSTTISRCGIAVYTIKNVSSMTPYDTASASSGTATTSVSLDCDTPSGDSVILAAFQAATSDVAITWTGPTEDFEAYFEFNNTSGASKAYTGAGTQTVTPASASNAIVGGVAISLQ